MYFYLTYLKGESFRQKIKSKSKQTLLSSRRSNKDIDKIVELSGK